jgi:acyl-CoA thioesterase-2
VIDPLRPTPLRPRRIDWLRTVSALPDSPALHYSLLAYASDHDFLGTALLPHGVSVLTPGMQIASLGHWSHRRHRKGCSAGVHRHRSHDIDGATARRARTRW